LDPKNVKRNRLASATSPYLRQHAENPVDWFPWDDEALALARQLGRPILLSVGYSACHWCHVMAHESFEDPAIADLMNQWFINIKVDREERPDVDALYQNVVQLLGQGGGWPLTVFLTPDLRPFYGGTYFPPQPAHGRPSFAQLLQALHEAYEERPEEVEAQAGSFVQGLRELAQSVDEEAATIDRGASIVGQAALADAGRRLLSRFDLEWGGLGRQPKFPNTTALELLLRLARAEMRTATPLGPVSASAALRLTLEKMWRGGIYDHLRGGFARYSVDRFWRIPHFEKMLYDNALLIGLYADAAALWPELSFCREVVEQSVDSLIADMLSPRGTFYSATDADSEGEEGKYFVWRPEEVRAVLGAARAERFLAAYGFEPGGNFEGGTTVLSFARPLAALAAALGADAASVAQGLEEDRLELLARRYTRPPPLRDEKILTAWNALLISGLVRASVAATGWGDLASAAAWEALAAAAAERLLAAHLDVHGRVLRAEFEGVAHTRGYLDDVAFLARACLDLYELTLEGRWRAAATALARDALVHHARSGGDGFYLSADDGEALIERIESQHDAATPSGLGVIVEVLLRLDALDAAPAGAKAAALAVLHRFRGAVSEPLSRASLIGAAQWADPSAIHVTVRAPTPALAQPLAAQVRAVRRSLASPLTLSYEPAERVDALICRGQVCEAPLASPEAVAAALRR
jgi:uncharacterized protein YyaL (SSP411 family)